MHREKVGRTVNLFGQTIKIIPLNMNQAYAVLAGDAIMPSEQLAETRSEGVSAAQRTENIDSNSQPKADVSNLSK